MALAAGMFLRQIISFRLARNDIHLPFCGWEETGTSSFAVEVPFGLCLTAVVLCRISYLAAETGHVPGGLTDLGTEADHGLRQAAESAETPPQRPDLHLPVPVACRLMTTA